MKRNNFIITCFLLASLSSIFFITSLKAQDLYTLKFDRIASENTKIEKGLSQNSVRCILQDQKGYMWFGTWDGLNKYDGYTFTIYNHNNGLSKQVITAIYEDKEGYIWIGTENGLNRFDRKNNTFIQYQNNPNDIYTISNNFITAITEDTLGNLWVGTQNGLNIFNKHDKKFHFYKQSNYNENSISNNFINHLFVDRKQNLWIGTNHGLNLFNKQTNQFKRFYHHRNSSSLSSDTVLSITQDHQGNLWIGTLNGLNKLNSLTYQFFSYKHNSTNSNSVSQNKIQALLVDQAGMLWVGTADEGLDMYDGKSFVHFKNTSNNPKSISNNRISSIYEDKTGTLWIGTFKGVNKIDKYPNKFTHYYHIPTDPNSLNNNLVWAIYQDPSGLLWIGTSGGVNLFDQQNGRFNFITNKKNNPNSLISNSVKSIQKGEDDIYWIGTTDAGFDKYQKNSNRFTHFQHKKTDTNSLISNNISCMLFDSKHNLWIGTKEGLDRFNPRTNQFTHFKSLENKKQHLCGNNIASLYEDRHHNIWISTYTGLSKYDYSDNSFYSYLYNSKNKNGLSHPAVFSVYEDSKGVYWICTMGGGLNKLDVKNNIFKRYTTNDGLPNNVLYNTLEDNTGNLWISTNYGLSKFNIEKETFINYDVNDGVQSNEFNLGAVFKNKQGEQFFGGFYGFNSFFPEEIKKNENIPTIVITAFKIFNKLSLKEYENGDTIRLNYSDNFFSFEFAALDYTNPSKNLYKYMLEKVDKSWIKTTADRRFAEYTNILPGTYTFRVLGSNNDGLWNEKDTSLIIIISPPWYLTWWFRISSILFAGLILWLFVSSRIRYIRRKNEAERKILEIQKQLFDLERKALRLQMNPHFIFNSLNSIQSFIINNDTEKAIQYLAKFSKLMRLILTTSREPYVPLSDEVQLLKYYLELELLRFDNKFEYSFTIDPLIDEEFIEVPPMLVQPYVENAILHGLIHKPTKGKILITFKKLTKETLLCIVEDNGIGREKSLQIQKESGLKREPKGMLITQERLKLLNKQHIEQFNVKVIDLKNEHNVAQGTRVEITIQYNEINE